MIFVGFVGALLAAVLIEAWLFMLLVGVMHAEWLPMMPTIGYGSSVTIMAVLSGIIFAGALLGGPVGALIGRDAR